MQERAQREEGERIEAARVEAARVVQEQAKREEAEQAWAQLMMRRARETVQAQDLVRLKDTAHNSQLNDTLINSYLIVLAARYPSNHGCCPSIVPPPVAQSDLQSTIVSILFFEKCRKDFTIPEWFPRDLIAQSRYIVVPIHAPETIYSLAHWYLAILHLK